MIELDKIYLGDSEELIKSVDNESIDLVVTSPPYDDLRTYGGYNEGWCMNKFKNIANELYRVLKIGGVVVWVINDKTFDGSKSLTSFKHAIYFNEIGFKVNDVMIWNKTNFMPQVRQPRYSDAFEYMIILSKGYPKTFNPLKEKCKCGGQEYNSTVKNMGGESGRRDISYIVNDEKNRSNVWNIAVAQNKTIHPAVFPIQIPYDHILTWTNEGDVVLDCFCGSGTTLMAAKDLRRKYIGFEINEEYYNLSNERISKVLQTNSLY